MAKSEHKKVNRPEQGGYDISLDPGTYNIKQVSIRFGTLDGNDAYKWGLTIGPIEFKSETKKTVIKLDDDQLPASAHSLYYQLLCEIDDETMITEPILLTEMTCKGLTRA